MSRERARPVTAISETKKEYLKRFLTPRRRPVRSNTDVEAIKRTRRRVVADPNLQENTEFLTPYHEKEVSGLFKRKPRRKYIFSRQGKRHLKNESAADTAHASICHHTDSSKDVSGEGKHCDVSKIADNDAEVGSDLSHLLCEIQCEIITTDKGQCGDNMRRPFTSRKYNCKTILAQQENKVDVTDTNDTKQYSVPHATSEQDYTQSEIGDYYSVYDELSADRSSNESYSKVTSGYLSCEPELDQNCGFENGEKKSQSESKNRVALQQIIKTNLKYQAEAADEWQCLDTSNLQRSTNKKLLFKPIVARSRGRERCKSKEIDNTINNKFKNELIRNFSDFSNQTIPRSRPLTSTQSLSSKDIFDFNEKQHLEKIIKKIDNDKINIDDRPQEDQETNFLVFTDTNSTENQLGENMNSAASYNRYPPSSYSINSMLVNPEDDCDNLSESDTLDDLSSIKFGERKYSNSPPHSALKKRGSIGSAGKKQRVKFDLDLEIHVVPRDYLHFTPVELMQSDEEVFTDEELAGKADCFNLDKNLNDQVTYENNEMNHDLNNAFGKVSIRGTLTPFRVISRDYFPASRRSSPSLTTNNYPTRRDSLDIIEMQKFLKQQARERALNSSSTNRKNASLNAKFKINALSQSSSNSLKVSKTSPPPGRYSQSSLSTSQHTNLVPRYTHLQLQRQYEEWEDRRRRKQQLYEPKTYNKTISEPKLYDSTHTNCKEGFHKTNEVNELPVLNTTYHDALDKKETFVERNKVSEGDSNFGIRRIMSADPSILSRSGNAQLRLGNSYQPYKAKDYFPSVVPTKTSAKTLQKCPASPKMHSRTYRQFQYDCGRQFANNNLQAIVKSREKRKVLTQTSPKTLAAKQRPIKLNAKDKATTSAQFVNEPSFNQFNFAKLSEGARSALKDAHNSYVRNFHDLLPESVIPSVRNNSNRSISTATSSLSSRFDSLNLSDLPERSNFLDEKSRSSSCGTVTVQSLGITAFTPNTRIHLQKRDKDKYYDNQAVLTFRNTGRTVKPVPSKQNKHTIKSEQKTTPSEKGKNEPKLLLSYNKISPSLLDNGTHTKRQVSGESHLALTCSPKTIA